MNSVWLSGFVTWIHYNKQPNPDKDVVNMYIKCFNHVDVITKEKIYYSFKIAAFGQQARYIFEHFKKNDAIEISGHLRNKPYIDSKTGEKRDSYCIYADKAYYPPRKQEFDDSYYDKSFNPIVNCSNDYEEFEDCLGIITPEDELPF